MAIIVLLALCTACVSIGSIVVWLVGASATTTFLPTIRAAAAATLTATARPQAALGASVPTLSGPTRTPVATLTPRPTSTIPPTRTLPPTMTPLPTRATATPIPKPQVAVQKVTFVRDQFGGGTFMGEIINSGVVDAGELSVTIELLGANGEQLVNKTVESFDMALMVLKPGQKTVWRLNLFNAPERWQEERIRAEAVPIGLFASREVVQVDGAKLTPGTKGSAAATASGLLINSGQTNMRGLRLTVACYDEAGHLVGVANTLLGAVELAPGGSAPFSVTILGLQQVTARYEFFARPLR